MLNVAEACAGLRSLMTFITVGGAVAFLSHRPLWQKLIITASAVPIAILCNVMRVSGQGLLDHYVSQRVVRRVRPPVRRAGDAGAGVLPDPGGGWILDNLFIEEVDVNGEDGLGAIYPAMANSVMMFDVLGYPKDHPDLTTARASIEKLLVIKDGEAYCQPCVSPVWDTGLACHAMLETGDERAAAQAWKGLEWLERRQVLDVVGDWAARRPNVRPGGWAFQYANPHYPDLDDTAVVVMAMDRAARRAGQPRRFDPAIARAREWVEGLQSSDGGWAAFDADNTYFYLNNIPFSDHGALLDPPSPDLTARCLSMLVQLGETAETSPAVARAINWLRDNQEKDGSWFGRWGVNYIYGTWSVLCALNAAGVEHSALEMRRAVDFLVSAQNSDGGWGEDCWSYKLDYKGHEQFSSVASQTAWALLGLMAAGEIDNPAVERGIAYLARTQRADGLWAEEHYSGTGFPRVFYLRYHGYAQFFPLWAVARYRNLTAGNAPAVSHGM